MGKLSVVWVMYPKIFVENMDEFGQITDSPTLISPGKCIPFAIG